MIESKTEKELNQIVRDLHAGQIYTDLHIPEHETMGLVMVFLPLAFMDKEASQKIVEGKPGMFYEYLSKAGPRSINGMPTFLSMQSLNEEDAEKVWEKVHKLDAAISEALGESDDEEKNNHNGESEASSTPSWVERSSSA